MSILVLEHERGEDAGRLGEAFRRMNHRLQICRLWDGDPIPVDLDNIDAVVPLGGSMNVSEAGSFEWMQPEMELIREAHDRQLPIVGVCLGAQLVAAALGGDVGPIERRPDSDHPTREIGWYEIRLEFAGTTETLLSGLPWQHMQFHWHSQEIKNLPDGAVRLAGSKTCNVQAFRCGLRTYGFQYHFEVLRHHIEAWSKEGDEERTQVGLQHGRLMQETDRHYPTFDRLNRRLCEGIAMYLLPDRQRILTRG